MAAHGEDFVIQAYTVSIGLKGVTDGWTNISAMAKMLVVVDDVMSQSGAAYVGVGDRCPEEKNSTRSSHLSVSPGFHLSLVKLRAISLNGGLHHSKTAVVAHS